MTPKIDLSPFNFTTFKPLLVAVSGGADSLALVHALRGCGYPLVCATFNHCLRPEAADEAAHVRQVAEWLGIPFVTDSADVAAYARAEGLSIEEAARILRYRFLFREAHNVGAQAVVTGHTADDQAETLLMHFLRGAGLAGLKGMPGRVVLPVFDKLIPLVRPLLGWWRADTEAYCRENGLSPIYDPSNADTTYFRNRLRHELIPVLESYNPRVRQALVRTALALQGDEALLAEVVEAAWQKSVLGQGAGYICFARAALEGSSPALRRNLFKRAAFTLRPGLRDLDFAALERASRLEPVHLAGGLRLFVEGEKMYLASYEADLPQDSEQLSVISNQLSVIPYGYDVSEQLLTTGEQFSLGNGWVLACESILLPSTVHGPPSDDPFTAWLDADLTGDELRVRTVHAGDRFQPLGMSGASVKLKDFFVNIKLPRRARAQWPLICVGDEIAWVAGLRLAHRFRVTEQTKRIILLQIKRLP